MVEIERHHLQNLHFVLLLTFLGQYFHYLSETKIWVETFLLLAEMPMNDWAIFAGHRVLWSAFGGFIS